MMRYHQAWANLPSFKEVVIRRPEKIRIMQVFKREKKVILYDDRILAEYNWQLSIKKYLESEKKMTDLVKKVC
jgi:hypothetical protein